MARVRGFASRGLTRSPRRKSSWTVGVQTGTNGSVQAISATGKTLATNGVNVLEDGLTLVRTRGQLILVLTSASAAGAGFVGAFGIGIVTAQAFAAGVASIPGPINDEDWDGWLFHHYFAVVSSSVIADTVSSSDDFGNSQSAVLRIDVDSRAMRKLEENQVIVGVLEADEIATSVMGWYLNSRSLVKLP